MRITVRITYRVIINVPFKISDYQIVIAKIIIIKDHSNIHIFKIQRLQLIGSVNGFQNILKNLIGSNFVLSFMNRFNSSIYFFRNKHSWILQILYTAA